MQGWQSTYGPVVESSVHIQKEHKQRKKDTEKYLHKLTHTAHDPNTVW